jgi:hypothetical protein
MYFPTHPSTLDLQILTDRLYEEMIRFAAPRGMNAEGLWDRTTELARTTTLDLAGAWEWVKEEINAR